VPSLVKKAPLESHKGRFGREFGQGRLGVWKRVEQVGSQNVEFRVPLANGNVAPVCGFDDAVVHDVRAQPGADDDMVAYGDAPGPAGLAVLRVLVRVVLKLDARRARLPAADVGGRG